MNKTYYKLPPDQIIRDIIAAGGARKVKILGREYVVHPSVYPSDRSRTTDFLLRNIKPQLKKGDSGGETK